MDPDEYAEYHESREELRETLAERLPVECPLGHLLDCPHFRFACSNTYDEEEQEWWCQYPGLDDDYPKDCPLTEMYKEEEE